MKTILKWLPAGLFVVASVVFLALFIRYQRKPVILDIDRLSAAPGDKISISGVHFGELDEGSKLFIGPHPITSTGILEWSDEGIVARVPRNDGAVLVKVKTRSGFSEGVVLGDSTRFPRVEYGFWLPGAPYVEYADPQSGGAGTLVTLRGEGFGDRRGGGTVLVNRSDPDAPFGSEAPDVSRYIEAESIESWTDDTVSFRLPEGASTGNIYVGKGGAFSNPVSFDVSEEAGSYRVDSPVAWSLRQEVSFRRAGSFPGNGLYVHLPAPEAGAGQSESVVIDDPDVLSGVGAPKGSSRDADGTAEPPPAEFLRDEDGLSLYRLEELRPGEERTVARQIVVTVKRVRASVNPGALIPYDPSNPELSEALAADPWIRPDTVSRTAARVIGNLRDDWSKGRAVYDYVLGLLEWSEDPPTRVLPEYISSGEADSEGYSFLFCSLARAAEIPARPVGGVLMTADGGSRKWWWAEIWIEGLGWVPVDPALGDGVVEVAGALEGLESSDAADFYYGGLDNSHVAFSRGIRASGPTQPDSRLFVPEDRYTLQGAYEEAAGRLESYRSSWPVPRPTARY